MAMKLINSYQAWWRPQDGKGHFWYTYFDGVRERTVDVNADSFSIVLFSIRNNPAYVGCKSEINFSINVCDMHFFLCIYNY